MKVILNSFQISQKYNKKCNLDVMHMTLIKNFFFFKKKVWLSIESLSRYILANKLLDDEFSSTESEVKSKIEQATSAGLQWDAWSNHRNKSIVNFLITTSKPVFYKTLATQEKHNAEEYMFQIIDEVLKYIGTKKFYAIVTDNASVMVKSRDSRETASDFSLELCIAYTKFINWRFTEN